MRPNASHALTSRLASSSQCNDKEDDRDMEWDMANDGALGGAGIASGGGCHCGSRGCAIGASAPTDAGFSFQGSTGSFVIYSKVNVTGVMPTVWDHTCRHRERSGRCTRGLTEPYHIGLTRRGNTALWRCIRHRSTRRRNMNTVILRCTKCSRIRRASAEHLNLSPKGRLNIINVTSQRLALFLFFTNNLKSCVQSDNSFMTFGL